MAIEVKKLNKNGDLETFTPHLYPDGFYRVEVPVRDISEVERLAAEGCAVRLKGDLLGAVNLIKPSKVK